MKPIFRTMFLALLAVLALSAVASASASAESCHKETGSKKYRLCVGGAELGYPTAANPVPVSSHIKTGTTAKFVIFGEEVVKCSAVAGSGEFESGSTGKLGGSEALDLRGAKLTFTSCEVVGLKNCKVTEPIVFQGMKGTLSGHSLGIEELAFSAGAEEVFGTIVFSSTCPTTIAGTKEIRGSEGCSPKQIEVETLEKELVCSYEKSGLETFHGTPIKLSLTEDLALSGSQAGKQFSAYESS